MNLSIYELSKLISKHIQEELSDSEALLLEEWLNENADNKKLFDRLVHAEKIKASLDYFDDLDVDSSWKQARRNRLTKKLKNLAPYIAYAATIAGVIFSILFYNPKKDKGQPLVQETQVLIEKDLLPGGKKAMLTLSNGDSINLDNSFRSISQENGFVIFSDSGELNFAKSKSINTHLAYNTLTVPKAGAYKVVLSDGTKVWLNSLTQLKFPSQFPEHIRKVHLTGEAYFEVAKDRSKPFIVEVNNNSVEVLGTHFNINSYNSNWKTTLFEGSVKVGKGKDSKLLNPGQEASIVGDEIIVNQADIKKAIAWKNNEFYFKNESMQNILLELSRWYDFEIDDNRFSNNKRYSGSIGRDLRLSEVLKILNYLSGYKFHFDGEKLILSN